MCPIHHFKNKRSSQRLKLATVRLKTYLWPRKDSDAPLEGFGFVADMSESGVGIYLGEKLGVGQAVRLAFESKGAPVYKGAVIWVSRYTLDQHFVGRKSLSFRIGIKFVFASEAERQRYAKFMEDVRRHATAVQPGMVF